MYSLLKWSLFRGHSSVFRGVSCLLPISKGVQNFEFQSSQDFYFRTVEPSTGCFWGVFWCFWSRSPPSESHLWGRGSRSCGSSSSRTPSRPGPQAKPVKPIQLRGWIFTSYKWPKINGFHWGVDGVVTLLVGFILSTWMSQELRINVYDQWVISPPSGTVIRIIASTTIHPGRVIQGMKYRTQLYTP